MARTVLKTAEAMSPAEKVKRANLTLLYHHHTHRLFCPNTTTVFPWEADLVSLTRAGLSHEFEIKISRADFRADFKKEEKHRILSEKFAGGTVRPRLPEYLRERFEQMKAEGGDPERLFAWHFREITSIPNYFWYVCIDFEPKEGELPEYAGLILLDSVAEPYRTGVLAGTGRWKDAPRIHRGKITEEQREHLYNSINARYWKWVEGAYQSI